MNAITFETLTPSNFSRFQESIMRSEDAYPEAERSAAVDYLDIVKEDSNISMLALLDSSYIGNVFADEPEGEDLEICRPHITCAGRRIIYVYNFIIDRQYQGKGYGHLLLLEFIKQARSRGFEFLVGHFRQNAILKIIKEMGGQERFVVKNWEGSGEDYVLCELDLTHTETQPMPTVTPPVKETEVLQPSFSVLPSHEGVGHPTENLPHH